MKHTFLSIFSIFTFVTILSGQNNQYIQFPIEIDGNIYETGVRGGLGNPQYSKIDLNQDGMLDLFIFDRSGDVPICYLYEGEGPDQGFQYAPQYANIFPEMTDWALLRDFDFDGDLDIFTQSAIPGIPGVSVYEGSINNDGYHFDLVAFPHGTFDVIQVLSGGDYTNLYVQSIDIPAIADFDDDGDLDIASFEGSGSYITYYKNISRESGYTPDTLLYEIDDTCWGKVFESDFDQQIFLSDNPNNCATSLLEDELELRHSGSTLLPYDANADGLMDMLVGDLTSPNLTQLINTGSITSAWVTEQETEFPVETDQVDLMEFVASYYEDIDGDGLKDLLVAPNKSSNTESIDVTWLYKNIGDNDAPIFDLIQKNFLSESTIDLGFDARPAIVDYNADGLLDLVVGTSGPLKVNGNFSPALYLFENTGSLTEPEFTLVDPDYGKLVQFENESSNFTPTFGDIDNDGDVDLICGNSIGTLYFVENTAGPNQPLELGTPVGEYMGINLNNLSSPSIADLNGDGLSDLIVGERNGNNDQDGNSCGNLNYYQNQGMVGFPQFDPNSKNFPNTPCLGSVFLERSRYFSYGSSPIFLTLDGEYHLFVGSDEGKIWYYDDIENNLYDDFNLVDTFFGAIDDGFRTHPALADFNDDGYLDMIVGNFRGGINAISTNLMTDGILSTDNTTKAEELIFPNPTKGKVYLPEGANDVRLYDANGRLIFNKMVNNRSVLLNQIPGLYFLELRTEEGFTSTHKLIITDH